MGKIIIKENGKRIDWIRGYEDDLGYYTIDCYQQKIRIGGYADAKNFANTHGGQTMGNGEYYYDTWEDLWEEMHNDYADTCEYSSIEELKADDFYIWNIGEEIGGEIEFIDEDEAD